MLISLDEVVKIPMPGVELAKAKSYFNHLLINPDGTRFIFLHRWGFPKFTGATRMFTANHDGSDLRVLDPFGLHVALHLEGSAIYSCLDPAQSETVGVLSV